MGVLWCINYGKDNIYESEDLAFIFVQVHAKGQWGPFQPVVGTV